LKQWNVINHNQYYYASKHPTTPTTQHDGDQNHETVMVSVHVMVAVDVFDVESTTIAIPE